jgi:hypothetical protein
MTKDLLLLFLGFLTHFLGRTFIHVPNFTPVGAIYSLWGQRFGLSSCCLIGLSEWLVGFFRQDSWHFPMQFCLLLGFCCYGCAAPFFKALRIGVSPWMTLSLGTLGFFFITNFAVWMQNVLYPLTWSGLAECYWQALPFLKNQWIADLFFFSLFSLPHVVLKQFRKKSFKSLTPQVFQSLFVALFIPLTSAALATPFSWNMGNLEKKVDQLLRGKFQESHKVCTVFLKTTGEKIARIQESHSDYLKRSQILWRRNRELYHLRPESAEKFWMHEDKEGAGIYPVRDPYPVLSQQLLDWAGRNLPGYLLEEIMQGGLIMHGRAGKSRFLPLVFLAEHCIPELNILETLGCHWVGNISRKMQNSKGWQGILTQVIGFNEEHTGPDSVFPPVASQIAQARFQNPTYSEYQHLIQNNEACIFVIRVTYKEPDATLFPSPLSQLQWSSKVGESLFDLVLVHEDAFFNLSADRMLHIFELTKGVQLSDYQFQSFFQDFCTDRANQAKRKEARLQRCKDYFETLWHLQR